MGCDFLPYYSAEFDEYTIQLTICAEQNTCMNRISGIGLLLTDSRTAMCSCQTRKRAFNVYSPGVRVPTLLLTKKSRTFPGPP